MNKARMSSSSLMFNIVLMDLDNAIGQEKKSKKQLLENTMIGHVESPR